MKAKPKFKVGQVVRINVPSYKNSEREYRKIKEIYQWPSKTRSTATGITDGKVNFLGFGYVFTGDECHEKYLKALSPKECGGRE